MGAQSPSPSNALPGTQSTAHGVSYLSRSPPEARAAVCSEVGNCIRPSPGVVGREKSWIVSESCISARNVTARRYTMVSEKVMRFQNKNRDLDQLSSQIEAQLKSDGYKTQSANPPLGRVIQAQKAGVLRDIILADRAFTIMITGDPNDFTVHIGIGKWVQNLAVAAVEVLLLSVLFLAVDVPEALWTRHVEGEIASKITRIVG
jgi:hypothetical protein